MGIKRGLSVRKSYSIWVYFLYAFAKILVSILSCVRHPEFISGSHSKSICI